MTETATTPTRPIADKRQALLAAALRLIARAGLHATPTSAVAREAGVAAGTLFLYFPTKEALLNALYLELLGEQRRAAAGDGGLPDGTPTDARALLWPSWHGLARWHLDRPAVTRVMQQLRGSGVLTAETRAAEQRAKAEGLAGFREAIGRGLLRDLPVRAFWALYAGPIFALAEALDDGEAGVDEAGVDEVTDEVLRATFEGVCRSVLPPGHAPGA